MIKHNFFVDTDDNGEEEEEEDNDNRMVCEQDGGWHMACHTPSCRH